MTFRSSISAAASCGLAVAIAAALATSSEAVVVNYILGVHDGQPGPPQTTPVNITAPADDPGWYRVPNPGDSNAGIYMGNQWMLSARHVSVPDFVTLPSGDYPFIPGSLITLSNPTNTGRTLSTDSDLMLYRIGVHPETGLAPEDQDVNIANDPFGDGLVQLIDSVPSAGTDVTMIGNGAARVVQPSQTNGHWHSPLGTLHGVDAQGGQDPAREKTWGTNEVSPATVTTGLPRLDGLRFITDINGREVVSLATQFNTTEYSGVARGVGTPTLYEAHAKGGDSGGPVFVKETVPVDPLNPSGATTEEWRLAGVLHATQNKSGTNGDSRPPRVAVFGDVTIFTDLSNTHYSGQIEALLANDYDLFESISGVTPNLNGYSMAGDINLDGAINNQDVDAFVAGWGLSQAEGDVYSWTQGDLNLDGKTDAFDFVLLREALPNSAGFTLASIGVVPEPGTAAMLFLLAPLASRRRR
ncbi:MAG: dockerin type I repeat-containing protein [Planctomycetota bacterium]